MIDDINNVENYLIKSLKLKTQLISLVFKHPEETRFKTLFQNIKIKRKKRPMAVNPKNIMLGIDRRTSIIIKNIPDDISDEEFKKIVMKYSSLIDFFYIPLSVRSRKKLRVAFINVVNYSQIVPIFMGLIYKMEFKFNKPNIEIEICYSKVQGKHQLTKRFSQELLKL